MTQILLLPIFVVWFGIAFPIAALILGTIIWCTVHVMKDLAVGTRGEIWCPVHERMMRVRGTPRRFLGIVPFTSLRRCERYGPYRIRCAKCCLEV